MEQPGTRAKLLGPVLDTAPREETHNRSALGLHGIWHKHSVSHARRLSTSGVKTDELHEHNELTRRTTNRTNSEHRTQEQKRGGSGNQQKTDGIQLKTPWIEPRIRTDRIQLATNLFLRNHRLGLNQTPGNLAKNENEGKLKKRNERKSLAKRWNPMEDLGLHSQTKNQF